MIREFEETLISVVIPLYCSGSTLRRVLKALYDVNYLKKNIEIIFSYYLSDDDTLSIVNEFKACHEEEYYNVEVLNCEKRGVSYERNRGIEHAKGKYIFLLDSDVCLHRETFRRHLAILLKSPEVGAVCSPCILPQPDLLEKSVWYHFEGRVVEGKTLITGCATLRNQIFDEVGYFDQTLGYPFSIHEDLELAARIINKRYKIIIDGCCIEKHLPKMRANKQNSGIRCLKSILDVIKNRLHDYFTSYADSYHKVLKSAPLSWKLEFIEYLLTPLPLLLFLTLSKPVWAVVYFLFVVAAWVSISLARSKSFKPIYGVYSLIVLLGRISRAYGYIFRRIMLIFYLVRNEFSHNS